MKNFSMLIAAALAATSFAAGAADKAPIQLTESQMGQVVAGATPDVKGAGLCTSYYAGGKGGEKFAKPGNPSHMDNGGPQDLYRGFGWVGHEGDMSIELICPGSDVPNGE